MIDATELRARFAAGELSPVEALAQARERIAARERELNAFITLADADVADAAARAAERAYRSGTARPLEGIPLAVKDLFDTAGLRTTYGSSLFADHVPTGDAAAVRLVRAAGAVIVGKTLTHEFAWGITSDNPHFGPTRNPADPSRVPGGSSGGSGAALAAGMCALALGSDTGGSIRIPASFCGVSGLKPTFGRLSAAGAFPLAPSLDHVGPMARTPRDVALFWQALTGGAPAAPFAGARIAVCPDLHLHPLAAGVARVYDAAVEAAAALERSRVLELPFPEAAAIQPAFATIQLAEARAVHVRAGLFPAHADAYGADVRARLERAGAVTLDELTEAIAVRARVASAFARLFETADLLLTPISAVAPEPVGARSDEFRAAVLPYTIPQDMTGLPALAIPAGVDEQGLPVGVQLTGPAGAEAAVLAAGCALYERLSAGAA